MIAYSIISDFQVRLPAGDDETFLLKLIVVIRDTASCITEFNLSLIYVSPESTGINSLVNSLQGSSNDINNNPIVQLLSSGNQNIVGQVVNSVSKEFNKMNNQSVNQAVSGNIFIIDN